jgi:two-component system, NarL family, response regulator DevR
MSTKEWTFMRIFIADDSSAILDRLVKMVSQINHTKVVGLANNGEDAITSIQKLKPDLVILDLHMPKVNGFDVIRNIKKNNLLTTVLVLTNFATIPHRELCKQLGVEYFYDKTTEFEQAIEVIERLASSCHAE